MSTQKTYSATELEELFDAEIPCGGNSPTYIPCGRAAVLRGSGHGCRQLTAANFKCMECWMAWYRHRSLALGRHGFIRCRECEQRFYDIDTFSGYEAI